MRRKTPDPRRRVWVPAYFLAMASVGLLTGAHLPGGGPSAAPSPRVTERPVGPGKASADSGSEGPESRESSSGEGAFSTRPSIRGQVPGGSDTDDVTSPSGPPPGGDGDGPDDQPQKESPVPEEEQPAPQDEPTEHVVPEEPVEATGDPLPERDDIPADPGCGNQCT